jgi:hypothetical protein
MISRSHVDRSRRHLLLTGAALVTITLTLQANTPVTRADADRLSRKIDEIVRFSLSPARETQSTAVSESEVNSYLRLELGDELPAGVSEPTVALVGEGLVAGRAVVDLDAVRKARIAKEGSSWLDPVQYLTGSVPVTARGALVAREGWARLDLHAAEVSGIPVPKMLLQEIVTYYSRSQELPAGVNLDAPFQLPARIDEIRVSPRQAVVVQR